MARLAGIPLLLCAVLGAQMVFFATRDIHEHSAQHCCALCHAGPPVFQQPAVLWGLTPVLSTVWLEPFGKLDSSPATLLTAGESRAPPV